MKRNVKRLFAALLAAATTMTSALPTAAAPKALEILPTQMMGSVDMSALSERVLEFLENYYTGETVDSVFGERIKGHNTEELKNAIWKAIFLNRDSNYIDFGTLGLEKEEAEQLTAEVVAEAGAEDAVMYSLESNSEGEASVMEVRLDPLYEAAYDEIDAATANATEGEVQAASADDGIMTLAEDGQQSTMEDAYRAFNEYQQFIDDNPDQFGITVPYTSVKDDENEEGGGPITSLVTIANQKVDADGDGVYETTMLDLFKAGYLAPDDLIQIIQMFTIGNQLGVQLLGQELLAARDEALAAIPSGVTDAQKLLALNDWLADKATFDMARIMELNAPQPEVSQIYTAAVGALQQMNMDEASAQQLASQLIGLWGGNQYGVLCPSMGNTGVCMSYTYAYAYLVQCEFSEIYKNSDGSWKSRLELNYIQNPEKKGSAEAAIALVDENTEGETEGTDDDEETETPIVPEHNYDYSKPEWGWAEDYSTAWVEYTCSDADCDEKEIIPAEVTSDETKAPTCTENGVTTYTATVQDSENSENPLTAEKEVEIPALGHKYENGKCSVCGEAEPAEEHNYDYSKPEWGWAEDYSTAWVEYTCSDADCDEKEIIPAEVTSEETKVPTCTEKGEKTYTATAQVGEETVTDERTVELPMTDHTWGNPVFVWNDDEDEANAVFTCSVCENEQTQKATVADGEVTKEATCTESGTINRTASVAVGETTYTSDPVEVTVPATGHNYGEDGKCTVCGAKEPADYIWSPDAPAMVDYVRITYDADVTMYGIEQDNFDSDHYWNAVKINGNWYYVDSCYSDIYIECMSRDRVETDGNVNHLYFMFSDTSARNLYDGNFKSIDTLYKDIATDTTYESAWFAFAKSPVYKNGNKYYYFYDSTDLIGLLGSIGGIGGRANNSYGDMFNQEDDYRLVSYDKTNADDADYTQTLINFVDGTVYTKDSSGNATMQPNDMIAELYAEHQAYKEKYPSIEISCDMEGNRLYFNISNCILYYDVDTTEVVKVFEYNEVTAKRDLSVGLGGMAFTVVDPGEEVETTVKDVEGVVALTVENNPIASMTIKNGNMYVSVGTTVAFISGKESMSAEDKNIGYQFEETNYNPDYNSYAQSSGFGEEEINDNDEFMWSANFVDVLDMSHVTGQHTYEKMYVEASCGKNAFYENRCTECGAIEPDTREEVEGTALEHHYVKFDEQYYTKTGDAWNTGTSYVCTICKDAKDSPESGDHVGHEYTGIAEWNEDYTEATMDILCESCYGVNYDCLQGDDSIVLAEKQQADITKERTSAVDENGERSYYYDYTATVKYGEEGKEVEYTDTVRVPREEDKYDRNPFTDVANDVWYTEPVLWAVENGITTGTTDTTFEPNKTCLRAEAVTFLWRVAGKPEPEGKEDLSFPDVKESSYYYKAVLWAAENGITTGFGDGTFKPNEICTRGQIVTFIWRMKGEEEPTITQNPFKDVKERDYYYDAVLWAVENEITNGYEDGDFKPANNCTRSEIVTFLYRGFAEEIE